MSVTYFQLVPSKMEKTKILIEDSLIEPYIPETRYLNIENLEEMLNKYSKVVFKPDVGGGGKKVGMISSNFDQYKIHYEKNFYENLTLAEVHNFIINLDTNKTFILQKGIEMLKLDENPFDIRVSIQKRDENWEITGIAARRAPDLKMVTNRSSGGKCMELKKVLEELSFSQRQIEEINILLYELTHNVANTLSIVYPNLKELGVDIGLDQKGRPWIFEVNTKPRFGVFKQLENKEMYNEIVSYHNQIIDSIDYYLRNGEEIKK